MSDTTWDKIQNKQNLREDNMVNLFRGNILYYSLVTKNNTKSINTRFSYKRNKLDAYPTKTCIKSLIEGAVPSSILKFSCKISTKCKFVLSSTKFIA